MEELKAREIHDKIVRIDYYRNLQKALTDKKDSEMFGVVKVDSNGFIINPNDCLDRIHLNRVTVEGILQFATEQEIKFEVELQLLKGEK